MAITEDRVVYHYRKYRVSSIVEFIPCVPVPNKNTATRIPKGSEVTFIRKIDNELDEVLFVNPDKPMDKEANVIVMRSLACECLLPYFKRN